MNVTTGAPSSVQELAERYLRAWNDHDLEAILSLQTPDSEFRMHGTGGVHVSAGIDACRQTYAFLLQAAPDQHFDVQSLVVSGNLYVGESLLSATFAQPWQLGDTTYAPTGRRCTFEAVDIIQCEGNLVKTKSSWIDGIALREQLEAAAR